MNRYLILLFIIMFIFQACKTNSIPTDPIPPHDYFSLSSTHVGEMRNINVWTPETYHSSNQSYPVLYMPDGGIKEDFPHIAQTIKKLIEEKKIPEIILVGIENTQRRRDLTGPTQVAEDKEIAPIVGGSSAFRSFIAKELIPEINKKYRTTERKGIIGESLAGLFVTETFLLHPELFDFYIAFDPSLWWNNQQMLKNASSHLDSISGAHKTFWFAGSNTTDIFESTNQLAEVLKAKNLPNLHWEYSPEKDEAHNTIFRATKEKAITWAINQ